MLLPGFEKIRRTVEKEHRVTEPKKEPPAHSVTTEPKFCKCRLCHEYFYADTIAAARNACLEHGEQFHPDWHVTNCYCPD